MSKLTPMDLKAGDLIVPIPTTEDGWYYRGLRLAEVIAVNGLEVWNHNTCARIFLTLVEGTYYTHSIFYADVSDFVKLQCQNLK